MGAVLTDNLLVLAGDPGILSLDTGEDVALLVVRETAPVVTLVENKVGVLVAPAGQGPAGPPGAPGRDGAGLSIPFLFGTPLVIWTLAHGLNRFPSVTLVDTAGDQVGADVSYLDANTIQVSFGSPTAGSAYLN